MRPIESAREVLGLTHGRRAHAAGLVITRQRPGAATGVVFLTLEDDPLNVIIWSSLFERERRTALGARLMGSDGRGATRGRGSGRLGSMNARKVSPSWTDGSRH